MLVAIDVGNTNIVIGVYKENARLFHFRIATSAEKSRDEYGMLFVQLLNHRGVDIKDIDAVIISSVVPPVMYSLERAVKDYLGKNPLVVTNDMDLGMEILYENPREVGADRLVNAVAVLKKYTPPAVVVDFGTATTFCAINEKGQYLGGAICPGIKISVEALFSRTAKLPRIELVPTDRIIGRSTMESMQAGVIHGYAGQVDYIVSLMKKEMNCPNAKVIATGGLASMISLEAKSIDTIDPMLTLDGLLEIYKMHKGETAQ